MLTTVQVRERAGVTLIAQSISRRQGSGPTENSATAIADDFCQGVAGGGGGGGAISFVTFSATLGID